MGTDKKSTAVKTADNVEQEYKAVYSVVKRIADCIQYQLLPIQGTGLSYEFTKNFTRCSRRIERAEAALKILEDKFLIKEKNKPVKFKSRAIGQHQVIDTTADGKYIPVADDYDGMFVHRVDINNPEYKVALEKWNKEVLMEASDFHSIPSETIIKLLKDGVLDGVDLTPLVGYVLDKDIFE